MSGAFSFYGGSCAYSVRMVIDCPEGTLLSWAGDDDEDD